MGLIKRELVGDWLGSRSAQLLGYTCVTKGIRPHHIISKIFISGEQVSHFSVPSCLFTLNYLQFDTNVSGRYKNWTFFLWSCGKLTIYSCSAAWIFVTIWFGLVVLWLWVRAKAKFQFPIRHENHRCYVVWHIGRVTTRNYLRNFIK